MIFDPKKQLPSQYSSFISVRLDGANDLACLLLSIKNEDGVELYYQKVDNIKKKILIDTCAWRCGLYSASIREENAICAETLFFLFGQKRVVILLGDSSE